MPTYGFSCPECGEQRDVFRARMCPPRRVVCVCKAVMRRVFAAPWVETDYPEPRRSAAAGIHPKQIPEAIKKFPHHQYDRKTGDMLFRSPSHGRRCLKDIGFHNRT